MRKHTQEHYCLCYTLLPPVQHIHRNIQHTLQSHSRRIAPTLSGLLHHHILITSGALVSSEQNQTATLKHTHTHACMHTHRRYPTPSVPYRGWHIKGPCPRREVREGLENHGRQRKRLRDKDQSEIWHFILGRSGRHTPFREGYITTEGRRERGRRRRGGRKEWGLSSNPDCAFPASTVCWEHIGKGLQT